MDSKFDILYGMLQTNYTFQDLRILQDEIISLGGSLGNVESIPSKRSSKAYLDHLWNSRINAYSKIPTEDRNKQNKLQKLYRDWEILREHLAQKYVHLVKSVARHYYHPNLDYNDLAQEGAKGLLRAIDCYNPDIGVPFEAFAPYWIRKYICILVENNSEIIRIPDSIVKKRRISKTATNLQFENICTEEGEETCLDECDTLEQQLIQENQRKILEKDLSSLPKIQQKIIQFRNLNGQNVSLEWVGQECGCSREKARIQEMRALKTLRKNISR